MATGRYDAALSDLRSHMREVIAKLHRSQEFQELAELQSALNALERLAGEDLTSAFEQFTRALGPAKTFRTDEFFGMTPLEAAKHYLRKVGEARPLREIMEAIEKHGGDPGREDQLRTALVRSTSQVAKVNEDVFGLVEFYPAIQKARRGRSGAVRSNGAVDTIEVDDEESPTGLPNSGQPDPDEGEDPDA